MRVPPFDLVLSYPQWQGSARHENLIRGAQAAAGVCGRYGPMATVTDAGPGETRGGINRWTAILAQFVEAKGILRTHNPARILTAGGDCACDVAVIDYLNTCYPGLTVVWIDAHLDANTPDTSPSGSFHGMPVATLLGAAPEDLRPLLGQPLKPAQFRYAATRVGDDGECAFRDAHGLKTYAGQVLAGPVHIHFDLDALDPVAFPHLAYTEGDLAPEAGLQLVRDIAASADIVGLTITEFAPKDDAGALEGSAYVQSLCEAALRR